MGERGEPEVNNLVYTKRQKHIYAIRKHETTQDILQMQKTFKFMYYMLWYVTAGSINKMYSLSAMFIETS